MYEFFQIADSLKRAGISVAQRASSLKICPNKPRLTVFIDDKGIPVDLIINKRQDKDATPLERWKLNNHMAFPTFAVDPLFTVDKDALSLLKKLCKDDVPENNEARCLAADDVWNSRKPLWGEKIAKKLKRQFQGGKLLLKKTGKLPPQALAFMKLVDRASMLDYSTLVSFLNSKFKEGLCSSPLVWSTLIDACFVSSDQTNIPTSTLLITLEVDDWHTFPVPANNPTVFDCVSTSLLSSTASTCDTMDAFGLPLVGYKDPMPKFLLPKSREIPLRSMFSDVAAYFRYHRAGADSFPVGSESRLRMVTAGKWITAPEREGETWAFLTGKTKLGRTDINPTIVMVAPQDIPVTPPKLAQLFAPVSDQARETARELKFEAIAADVAKALRGAWNGDLSVPISVSVITSYDKGRFKLLMSDTFTAEHFLMSAREWQDGCRNIPPMRYRVISKNKFYTITPAVPLPSQLIPLLATVWRRSGTECSSTRQVAQDLPAHLLLSNGQLGKELAISLLRQHVDDHTPVLLALGLTRFKDKELRTEKNSYQLLEILPSVLGLLLLKAGRPMGDYMQDSYYLTGRLLSLADTLHEQYCKAVRDGDIPPSLLGNSLMRTALKNPVEAVEQLADRILVYQAWARSSQKENSRLGKWALGQFSTISDALKEAGLPQIVTPTGKAELLLGYLAGAPKKDSTDESTEKAK